MPGRRLLGGLAVGLTLAGLMTAFALPYRGLADDPDPPVRSLLGPLEGAGRLVRMEETDGSTTWLSITTRQIPDTLVGGLPADVYTAITARLGGKAEEDFLERGVLEGADVFRDELVERAADGSGQARASLTLLDEEGYAFVASIGVDGSTEVYDPPLELLPADPQDGDAWASKGKVGAGATYEYEAEVVADGPEDPELGPEVRCITVRSSLTVAGSGGQTYEQSSEEQWCEGLGSVAYTQEVPEGTAGGTLVAVDGLEPIESPPVAPVEPEAQLPTVGEVDLVRSSVVTPISGIVTPSPSLLPAVVEGKSPTVLMGTMATPALQAVRAVPGEGGNRAWTAATRSTTFGSPLVDAAGGRIFVGSASGEVRAHTSDGLFLWAADVGDNVATRPALADGTLVVGSEDGTIVGLDPDSGEIRWRTETGGPVVSWPAAADGLVVIGCDDGIVRALDPEDGSVQWSHEAAGPVEAPIVAADGGFLVADVAGDLSLLAADGEVIWTAATDGWLRTLPVVTDGLVVVVLAGGDVVAYGVADGVERWRHESVYVGPAAPVEGAAAIVAATEDGDLVAFDAQGREVERWEPPASLRGPGSTTDISVGPVAGAGALWVVDDAGQVQRLGPAQAGASEERAPVWAAAAGTPPLESLSLRASPLVDGDDVYLIDGSAILYPVEPGVGPLPASGRLDLGERAVTIGGAAADGVGYLAAAEVVVSFSLPDGAERWRAEVPGSVLRPPVLADDVVLVSSDEGATHHLTAFDARTGAVRWQEETGTSGFEGVLLSPLVVSGDVVVAGDPVAGRSLEDGRVLWTSEVEGALGGGAVLPGGELVVTATDARGDAEAVSTFVVALDPETGDEVGRTELDDILAEGLVDLIAIDDVVIVQDGGRRVLQAVDPLGEETVWEAELPGPRLGGAAHLGDGLIWVALVDGRAVAIDPADGAQLVRTPELGVDLSDSSLAQVPVLAGDIVVVSAGLVVFGVPGGAP